MGFKIRECSEEEWESFYLVILYCERCGKDIIIIIYFDEVLKIVWYECECGNEKELFVLNINKMKLNWKIDWLMRWMIEDVIFELGGRDYLLEMGSYNVLKEIVRKIFNWEVFYYVVYDFIGIKGNYEKMFSFLGNSIILSNLLKVYILEVIFFMFVKYKLGVVFYIGLDEDVICNYIEYEWLKDSYENKMFKNEDLFDVIKIFRVDSEIKEYLKFN